MPQNISYVGVYANPSILYHFAQKLSELMQGSYNGRKLRNKDVVRMYNETGATLFPGQEVQLHASRLSRLLAHVNGYRPVDKKNQANALLPVEVTIFTAAFGVTEEELTGTTEPPTVITRHSPIDRKLANEFQKQYRHFLKNAVQLIGWAEFWPCSLETREFMEAHHESQFTDLFPDPDALSVIVNDFNLIGNERLDEFERNGIDRAYDWTHIMFLSDLTRITDASDPDYQRCSNAVRQRAFRHLMKLVRQRKWKVDLAIIDDVDSDPMIDKLKKRLHDFDSKVVLLGLEGNPVFSFWRRHNGELSWTSETANMEAPVNEINELFAAAKWHTKRNRTSVVRLLQKCLDDLESWS